jgi:L-rhamnose mutarotase
MKRVPRLAAAALVLAGASLFSGCATAPPVQRFGAVIGLKPEKRAHYKQLHANPWEGVLRALREAHVRNYSIYLGRIEGKEYLFGYFEYTGRDFAADMRRVAADETVIRWWKETDPCQVPIAGRKEGDWWMGMEEVFHMD